MIHKILSVLRENGKCKRTQLALRCKIPYDRFCKYLSIMMIFELLVIESGKDGIFINMTELGKRVLDHGFTNE